MDFICSVQERMAFNVGLHLTSFFLSSVVKSKVKSIAACVVGWCRVDLRYLFSGAIKRFLDCHPIRLLGISKYQTQIDKFHQNFGCLTFLSLEKILVENSN